MSLLFGAGQVVYSGFNRIFLRRQLLLEARLISWHSDWNQPYVKKQCKGLRWLGHVASYRTYNSPVQFESHICEFEGLLFGSQNTAHCTDFWTLESYHGGNYFVFHCDGKAKFEPGSNSCLSSLLCHPCCATRLTPFKRMRVVSFQSDGSLWGEIVDCKTKTLS